MKVIQNKIDKKTRRVLSLMLPLGLRRSLPSPRGSRAHPRAAALRRPFGEAFSATRLILPVSFLMVLSFLYINIYVGNALMKSSAVTEGNEVTVQDESMLTIGFVDDGGNPTTNTTNIALQPTADGVFNSGNVNVNVDTNSPLGYTLTMSASTSSLSRSEAVGNMTPVIPTLTTAVAQADFPNNYWGYKRTTSTLDGATEQIADTLYQPMRENYNIPISSTGASASKSISTVNFGVKLDTNTPSGNYNININFLAVSNVAPNLAYMQDATSTSLAAAMPSVGDTTVLYDRRDGKEYTVAKLPDGKYWVLDNLRLDLGAVSLEALIGNTNASATTLGYLKNGGGTYPYVTAGVTAKAADGGSWANSWDIPYIATSGTDNNGWTSETVVAHSGAGSGMIGIYYNYCAASAGSYCYSEEFSTGDATEDICPANWRMPTGGNGGEYSVLCNKATDSTCVGNSLLKPSDMYASNSLQALLSTPLSGGFLDGVANNQGTDGTFWSSTRASNTHTYNLYLSATGVAPLISNSREVGRSVRCLFDATMQNFTSEDADAMALHQEEILVDARDGKNYYVTKLKDGNVWMTQNLDFDITGPLDSTTTNLTVAGEAPYVTDYTKDNTTGIITWTPSSSLYTISASTTNQAFTWSNNFNNPVSVDLGDWYYRSDYYNNDDCGDQGCNYHTGNAGSQFSQTPGANGTHSHVGNYYNWSAAVASSDTSGYDSGNAVNSLCPANWNLPVNGMYGTLNSLYNPNITIDKELGSTAAADKALLAAPLYFVRAGGVWSSALHYAGYYGVYWSSTVYSSSYVHELSFRSSAVWPASYDARDNGRSLRCVLSTE